MVGALGSVGTTATVGAAALKAGLTGTTGLVTALPPFAAAGLPSLHDLVFAGHDLVQTPLLKRADALAEQGVLPGRLLAPLADEIEATDRRILPGITSTTDEPALEGIQRVGRDLREFRAAYGLSTVVVVNVATTEAPTPPHPAHPTLAALETALAAGEDVLPPSSLYAYAALDAGCPFVDFTPSLGARLPALEELARLRGVPHAGRDGKTGETLVKSALAPMFADRALLVRSWSGTNLLGGGDGAALAEPGRVRSKLDSKGRGLAAILGYEVEAPLRIEYVADLGEWKTAWDHIGFEGFLGTRMRMQFTWEGCDSALAAPLVVDLARLVARAHVRGEHGALPALAFFFKDPVGTAEQRLDRQFALLCDWATRLGDGS
jgi:myo-inositol-1-phosphate synthase